MDDFISYYWTPEALEGPGLVEAFQRLIAVESGAAEKAQAFGILLESDSVVAQGIAFDHFFYANSLSRYGMSNPFSGYLDELLIRAREQLRSEPVINTTPDGKQVVGANHASAFGVLAQLGEDEDLNLIAPILETSRDSNVVFAGCLAAQRCLGLTKKSHPEVISSLTRIIHDETWSEDLRVMAVRAFADYELSEVEDILIKVAMDCPLPISAYAADMLAHGDLARHRAFLRQVSDSWPENARYPASEVRQLLLEEAAGSEENDE